MPRSGARARCLLAILFRCLGCYVTSLNHPSIHREGHCRSFWKLPKMKRRQRNYYDHFRLYFFYRVSTFRVEFNLFHLNRGHSGKRWKPNFTCLKLCQQSEILVRDLNRTKHVIVYRIWLSTASVCNKFCIILYKDRSFNEIFPLCDSASISRSGQGGMLWSQETHEENKNIIL